MMFQPMTLYTPENMIITVTTTQMGKNVSYYRAVLHIYCTPVMSRTTVSLSMKV